MADALETVLITGAASGIGRATAQRLAQRMQVVIADRDIDAARTLADELMREGRRAFPVELLRRGQGLVGKKRDDRVHLGIHALDLGDERLHHLGMRELACAQEAGERAGGLEDEVVHGGVNRRGGSALMIP